MKTYFKTIFKTITNNKSRFLSMMLIIMLGICFVTGVGGITPKLEDSISEEFIDKNVSDLIIKTSNQEGFSSDEINLISSFDFIKSIEFLTSFEDTIDNHVVSFNFINFENNNINKLTLQEGRMPSNQNEVVVERKSNTIKCYNIGDEILYNDTKLIVTGIVYNPLYFCQDGEISNDTVTYLSNIIYLNFNSYLQVTNLHIKFNNTSTNYFKNSYIEKVNYNIIIIKSKINTDNYFFLTIYENKSFQTLKGINDKIDVIATMFPIFFILVVCLVILTTMTRLITEERKYIGCYKSLGISNNKILFKYIFFSLICSLLGIILGLISGAYILPTIIYKVFNIVFFLPKMTTKINIITGIISSLIMIISILFVTIYITIKDISETPANLFRPKAPKDGKTIFLEKITFIWKRLKFKYKSCYRNIFRYKGRLLMIVISVLGSTALVFAGLGLYSISSKPLYLNGIKFDGGDSIKYVAIIVVIFALLLTILVLHNITNMNISERNREISTLKVLGYYDKEVCMYIFREIIQMALIGVILGIPSGLYFLYFIMKYLEFGSINDIGIITYILSFILVFIFIIIVNLILIPKIKKVNMNDSLKSLE